MSIEPSTGTASVDPDPVTGEAPTAAPQHEDAPGTPDVATDTEAGTDTGTDAGRGSDDVSEGATDRGTRAAKGSGEGSVVDTEGEVAADYLEELLDIADLDGDIDTYAERGRAQVSIVTDSTVLVGAEGEVLEALQELVRLAVMAETGNRTRLMLDVAGFRDKRRKELRDLAADAVEEARAANESVRLAPMNPFERKIVHDAVAEAGLTSESEGQEPHRLVVVQPV